MPAQRRVKHTTEQRQMRRLRGGQLPLARTAGGAGTCSRLRPLMHQRHRQPLPHRRVRLCRRVRTPRQLRSSRCERARRRRSMQVQRQAPALRHSRPSQIPLWLQALPKPMRQQATAQQQMPLALQLLPHWMQRSCKVCIRQRQRAHLGRARRRHRRSVQTRPRLVHLRPPHSCSLRSVACGTAQSRCQGLRVPPPLRLTVPQTQLLRSVRMRVGWMPSHTLQLATVQAHQQRQLAACQAMLRQAAQRPLPLSRSLQAPPSTRRPVPRTCTRMRLVMRPSMSVALRRGPRTMHCSSCQQIRRRPRLRPARLRRALPRAWEPSWRVALACSTTLQRPTLHRQRKH